MENDDSAQASAYAGRKFIWNGGLMGNLFAALAAVAFFATPVVAYFFWRGMRKADASRVRAGVATAFVSVLYAMLMLVFVGVGAGMDADHEAQQAGFADSAEMKTAAAEGAHTKAEYQAILDKRAREAAAQAAAAAQKKLEDDAAKEKACATDGRCMADKFAADADGMCTYLIEHSVKWDFKWTNGWLTPRYPIRRWHDEKHTAIDYVGDAIKVQNGFGAWSQQIYRCTFDIERKTVIDLRFEQGRL